MNQEQSTSQGVTGPLGFQAAGGAFGIKVSGKPDLMVIAAAEPCAAAAVYTTNAMKSAPVLLDMQHLKASRGKARAILCNSGNANASTGEAGARDARQMCVELAQKLGCKAEQVLVCSTGIIGRPLPMAKISAGIDALAASLSSGEAADAAAATAIMTTDLVPKSAFRQFKLGRSTIKLAGICKGSGMIAPNMATMLAFVTTDAAIAPAVLQRALRDASKASFNRISVDQHTSPSDTCIVLASGLAGNKPITAGTAAYRQFLAVLTELCADLAYQIVKDGEGATKVYRVVVTGAASEKDADRVGRVVVDSPLVKCAVHGSDPNWGRITTAAGYSGAKVVAEKMSLHIGDRKDICVFRKGQPTDDGKKPGEALKQLMSQKEITFTLDLGVGKATATWLGCDLSKQYVTINADYTT